MSTSRRPLRRVGAPVLLAVCVLATACVGSVDREEFERTVQARGGGLSQTLVIDAVHALQTEIGVDPLVVDSIVATNETVTISAVSSDFPDELDRYTYKGDDLDGPDPVNQGPGEVSIPGFTLPDLPPGVEIPDSVQDLLDGAGAGTTGTDVSGTFSVADVSLDRLNAMVDEAIDSAGLRGAYADSLTIGIIGGTRPRVLVNVTNDRRTASVSFGPGGRRLATP